MRGVSIRAPAALVGVSLALMSAWAGPVEAAPAPIPVVASTNVYGDVVGQIGGERVSVTSIISDPSQNPHSYEASTRTRLEPSRAEVVVQNGGGYAPFVGEIEDKANVALLRPPGVGKTHIAVARHGAPADPACPDGPHEAGARLPPGRSPLVRGGRVLQKPPARVLRRALAAVNARREQAKADA